MVSLGYCLKEKKTCVRWVERYFDDCLCNINDDVSFALGIASLLCWGVAEIPQIITNFRTKSSHGVSLSFLLAWVAGDIFNLVGCLLEPATLPTQFYTALLYTVSTVVLVIQTIYYDYIYKLCRHGRTKICPKDEEDEEKRPLKPPKTMGSAISIPGGSYKDSPRREFYYTSARSLAGSGTPPLRTSYFRVAKSGPSALAIDNGSSSDEDETMSTCPVITAKTTTQPRPIPRPLYTVSTVVLVIQTIYYDYIYKLCRHGRTKICPKDEEDEEKRPLKPPKTMGSAISIPGGSYKDSPRREFYYTSARSLAGSGTPPLRTSYFRVAKSGPSALAIDNGSSSDEDETMSTCPVITAKTTTQPRPIPRPAGFGTFLAASASLPLQAKSLAEKYWHASSRRLLNERRVEHSALGQWLGWLMAAIYMGGRIPQIWLNIKRGSVEGLNPLMFIFALVANATYVGSILVRTTEWDNIKPNLPWLLDAIVCVVLDLFIILQYIYYKYCRMQSLESKEEDVYGDYVEASKTFVS
ncbi:PQ-loop repeat [Arabidopsis suecica]|uniref:PQ-loop repeat n=1 Tax=Arabidopsis suecica TaxID=45249 RepID=A0A8T1YFF5_ARASU|nr:PQ-loop repeat [Arabidopsis suecica]